MVDVPSFVTGTRIATARGAIAMEDLTVGDLALTPAGEARPIRRIEHRRIACQPHFRPEAITPVRVARNAFGPGRPDRDLLLSPGHSVCIDVLGEVLVPIIALVNGATVAQIDVEDITYWHVELDSHGLLLAEGLPTESCFGVGNRGFSADGTAGSGVIDPQALPDTDPIAPAYGDLCRPYRAAGALITVLRERLRERAVALGWRLEPDLWAGMHLLVDGVRIEPAIAGLSTRFAMPAAARDVWLVSDTAVPSEVSDSLDERVLGVCVEGIEIEDGFGATRPVDLTDPVLCVGFHYVEEGPRRWTAGRARLPHALWAWCRDGWSLRVDLAEAILPRWRAPRGRIEDLAYVEQGGGRGGSPMA